MSTRFTKGKLAADLTDQDLLTALQEHAVGSTLTRCAQAVGTNRYELKKAIDADPELSEAWERANQAAGDYWEEQYIRKARSGDGNAIKFMLLTKKPEYKDSKVTVTHQIEQPTAKLLAQARNAGNDEEFRMGVLAAVEAFRAGQRKELEQVEVIDHE